LPIPWEEPRSLNPSKTTSNDILQDVASGEYPVVSYWKQTLVHSDNRLPALATDRSNYEFDLPAGAEGVQLTARLLFRRVYQELAEEKQWAVPDIVLAQETVVEPWQQVYLPMISAPLH
jgi:hypothetical protein